MRVSVEKPGSRRSGFTLTELMVVVVLIGIMTAMILPEMKGTYGNAVLRSTGRKLVDVLALANSWAITVHQTHRVRIDRKSGHYLIEKAAQEGKEGGTFVPARDISGSEGTISKGISVEFRPVDEDSSNAEQGTSLIAENSFRDESIAFYPDGTSDSGEIRLRDAEGFSLALRLNPTTARVHLVELKRE